LFIVNLVAGVSGYYMSLLMQGYAFLSDVTTPKKRALR